MRYTQVTIPEVGLIAGTRGILGVGLGFLLSDRLPESQRKAAGWALFLVGAISTIPLAFEVLGRRCTEESAERSEERTAEEGNVRGRPSRRREPART